MEFDHAGDKYTRIYQTWVLIFVNKDPIIWYSKRHNTVETSTFFSEFIALKTATELFEALQYKLRMFGIPIEVPSKLFCGNEYLYKNVSNTDSTLKNKNIIICYHNYRKAVAVVVAQI